MNRMFGFVLALLVLGGVIYILFPYLRTGQTVIPLADTPSEAAITTATMHEETDAYLIDVKYPQFGIAVIDADIKSKVDTAVTEFKVVPVNPPESLAGQAATPQNEFTGTFEDVYIGPDVVSVKLVLSQYTGGAHPLTLVSGVNYDRATGRQLLQNDAFTMLGMTAEEVSARATAELKAKLGDGMFEEGTNSNPENFSSFIISADSVTFIFQPYQVAAYAAGPQEVSFDRIK